MALWLLVIEDATDLLRRFLYRDSPLTTSKSLQDLFSFIWEESQVK